MKRKESGFTLVELLIVISIIAILMAIVIANLNKSKKNTNYVKRLSDINQVNLAIQRYNVSNYGKYPTTSGSWYSTGTCVAQSSTPGTNYVPGIVPTYNSYLPTDPLKATDCINGSMYMYKSNGIDYKLIVYNVLADKEIIEQKNPSMVDPARSLGVTGGFGFWTTGAATW